MIGKKLGRYEILGRLGAGGMGEVYRAKDADLGRSVALKVLPLASQTDPDRLHRFEHEARAASALNHPNIVTIYEIGYTDGAPFIAMELVEGNTLRALLGRRPFLNKRALALAAQAAEGLAKAHAAGIVHRDLKPENIMVTPDGFVKILDFGLAKLLHDSGAFSHENAPTSPATRPGVVMGTVGYMSPEQARGKPLDFRSDQFACGAILYEMATGRRAFERETAVQTLAAIIDTEPEPIQSLNPDVPAPFRWIVERCLKKNPEDRYASTVDLARELRNVHDRLEEVSGSGSRRRTMPMEAARRGGWLGPVGVASLLAVAVAAVALVRGPGASAAPRLNEAVAILPLRNLSALPGDETLGIAMTDAVTTKLSEIPALTVVDRTTVREFRDKADDFGQAARDMGADFIVTGGVQRAEKRLAVTVRLIKPDNTVSWAQQYDGTTDDLFGLQRQVALGLSSALRLRLTSQERRRIATPPTANPEAYADYLQARAFLERPDVPQNVDRAIDIFERAIAKDKSFALAHAGLGEAYWEKYRATKDPSWTSRATSAILEAIRIDPRNPQLHLSLALVYHNTGNLEGALSEVRQTLAEQPSNDEAHRRLAETLAAQGHPDEAIRELRQAIDLRPSYWRNHTILAGLYLRTGRFSEATATARRVTELQPDNSRGFQLLGAAYQLAGDLDKAAASYARSIAIAPDPRAYTNLGKIYYDRGQFAEAAAAFERALQAEPTPIKERNLGDAYARLGDKSRARDAYQRGAALAERLLQVNPRDFRELSVLAVIQAKLGNSARAESLITDAIGLNAGDAEVQYRRAVILALGGRSEPALAALTGALSAGYSRALADSDPDLASLRSQSGYSAAMLTKRASESPKERNNE